MEVPHSVAILYHRLNSIFELWSRGKRERGDEMRWVGRKESVKREEREIGRERERPSNCNGQKILKIR